MTFLCNFLLFLIELGDLILQLCQLGIELDIHFIRASSGSIAHGFEQLLLACRSHLLKQNKVNLSNKPIDKINCSSTSIIWLKWLL